MRRKWLTIGFALCLTLLLPITARAATDAELIAASNLDVSISGTKIGIVDGREYFSIIGRVNEPSQVRDLKLWSLRKTAWSSDEIAEELEKASLFWKRESDDWTPSKKPPFSFDDAFSVNEEDYGKAYNVLLIAIDENINSVGYCIVRVTMPEGETYSIGDVYGGVCGDPNINEGCNLTWVLDNKGTLTISGTGRMADWSRPPWYDYRTRIKTVVIEPNVTSVGEGAFTGCQNIASVSIPSSVTSIDSLRSDALTDIYFGGNEEEWFAAHNQHSIGLHPGVTIHLKNGVTFHYRNYGFSFSTVASGICGAQGANLTWILDRDGTLTISGKGNMADWDDMTDPPWSAYAFEIHTIIIQAIDDYITLDYIEQYKVTSIGSEAFRCCANLISVTIQEGVTNIGYCAFADCEELIRVMIPNSVTSIGNLAFDETPALTDIYYGGSEADWNEALDQNGIGLADSVTVHFDTIAGGVCGDPNVNEGKNVTWTLGRKGTFTISGTGAMADYVFDDPPWYSFCCYGNDVIYTGIIEDGVTNIGNEAFSGCYALTSVTIPDSVTSIGNDAFEACHALASVTIPDSVTSIGGWAFAGCALTSVTIPENVTSIGNYAFRNCSSLTNVTIHGNRLKITRGLFDECDAFTSLTITGDGTLIDLNAFVDCDALTSVTISGNGTQVGYGAFASCESLTDLTISNGVTSIGGQAFADCHALTSVTIPSSVTIIKQETFFNCVSLAELTIPSSVTKIGVRAFSDCVSLTSVTIPSNVTSIEDGVFGLCTSLTSVIIPSSVTSIGHYAFYGCDVLTDVYFGGTEAEWSELIGAADTRLPNTVTVHYNYAPPAAEIDTITVTGGVVTAAVTVTETATVYFAAYDDNGRFLGVEARQLDAGASETLTFTPNGGAASAKLMLVGTTFAPLCGGESVNLSAN